MSLRRVILNSEAEWMVLSRANEQGKFAVPLDTALPEDVQRAFERGQINGWYTLIDVSYVGTVPGAGLSRIYLLTNVGWYRRSELYKEFAA